MKTDDYNNNNTLGRVVQAENLNIGFNSFRFSSV